MPIVKCRKCGKQTNSATSDYWKVYANHIGPGYPEAAKCWAAWDAEKEKYVVGCAFDELDDEDKKVIMDIVNRRYVSYER